jgi:hypothetical protein
MNVRPRVFDNRKLARAQAALVVLLYVFFCTFGMLTHTHTSEDMAAAEPDSRTVSAASPQTSAHCASDKQTLKAVPHCAFCDWEANNQARTVLPVRLSAPSTIACVYLRTSSFATPVFSTRSSSRAPPVA